MTAVATPLEHLSSPAFSAALALVAAALLLSLEGRRLAAPKTLGGRAVGGALGGFRAGLALAPLFVLLPLAAAVAAAGEGEPAWSVLAVGLVAGGLARMRQDLLHSECALKLVWVMGGALALSWAGLELLVLATGTPVVAEQWAVLELRLEPRFLWSTALPLSLLVGLVMLGGAPFHFWAADMFQGVRPWLAPLAVAALQVSGAGWLTRRLAGVEQFTPAAEIIESLLGIATLGALLIGTATLVFQRHPVRRVGTLASLNGALVLAALATTHGAHTVRVARAPEVGVWAAHLVLALSGAVMLARFMPVSTKGAASGPVLFRRHPWSGLIGLYALFSLSGIPGTPGARLWLGVAQDLAATGRTWILIALGIAWLAAFGTGIEQLREAFGVRSPAAAPEQPVPWQARAAMWVSGGALLLIWVAALGG